MNINNIPNVQKLLHQVKKVFYQNEQKLVRLNEGKSVDSGSRYSSEQNALFVILNILLFDGRIDVISFLLYCSDISDIDSLMKLEKVEENLFTVDHKITILSRKIDLILNKYSLNDNYEEEKLIFYEDVKKKMVDDKILQNYLMKIHFIDKIIEVNNVEEENTIVIPNISMNNEEMNESFVFFEDYLEKCEKRTEKDVEEMKEKNKIVYSMIRSSSKKTMIDNDDVEIINNYDIEDDNYCVEDEKELNEMKENYEKEVSTVLETNRNVTEKIQFTDSFQFLSDPMSFKKREINYNDQNNNFNYGNIVNLLNKMMNMIQNISTKEEHFHDKFVNLTDDEFDKLLEERKDMKIKRRYNEMKGSSEDDETHKRKRKFSD